IDECELANGLRRCRGELGGEEATEGMPDQCRSVESQLVEQLALIDDEVVPVVERMNGLVVAAAGARKLRCKDRVAAGKACNERTVGIKPPRPVQIDERRAVAGNFDFGLDPVLPEPELAHFRSRHVDFRRVQDAAARAGDVPATGRFALRRSGHQRSSYLSSHKSAIFGKTSRANRSMFFLHSSVGMEPKCSSASRWPMRARLMPSRSCSRTVLGLPTMTKPRS